MAGLHLHPPEENLPPPRNSRPGVWKPGLNMKTPWVSLQVRHGGLGVHPTSRHWTNFSDAKKLLWVGFRRKEGLLCQQMKWRLKDAKPPRMPVAKWRFFLVEFPTKKCNVLLVVTVNGRRSILKYDLNNNEGGLPSFLAQFLNLGEFLNRGMFYLSMPHPLLVCFAPLTWF